MPRTTYTDYVGTTRKPDSTLANPCTCERCAPYKGRTWNIDGDEPTQGRNGCINPLPVTRTPEQMGTAVPITTPWPSSVRE